MSYRQPCRFPARASIRVSLLALAALAAGGCKGDTGPVGPPGPSGGSGPTNQDLVQGDDTPGLAATILSVSGGTGTNGAFRVGDTVTVNYTLKKSDATDWDITELSGGSAMISGPTFNYQRVIAEQNDLIAASVQQADGSYRYTFPLAIPATYLPPFFDTPSFGPEDGELTGQPLLDGTYTVGFTIGWNFTVDDQFKHDTANATFDFLLGSAAALQPREVVKMDNCNRCHERLRVHGDTRQDVKLCVLCHTAGAEDNNILGNTPGVSIDFRVLIHKLHSGQHLPSVLGVSTNPDGSRNYAATPQPYVVATQDFSNVAFPAWPQGLVPMPRDQGYSALSSANKATEDTIRKGPSNCVVCHGDPDGAGPLTAPTQGDLYKAQPTRQACGSCHDDVIWGQNYTANGQTMGAQANNANCIFCHATQGNGLAVADAHLHPLLDPTFDPGLNLVVTNLTEAGTNNNDGTIDPGEKIQFRLRIRDDAGVDIDPATIAAPTVVISGPTDNYNLILNATIPTAALTGPQPFTLKVPMEVDLERVGVSTSPALQSFTTTFTPHLNVSGALTTVQVRTATSGGNTTLAAATAAPQNYVDVSNATGFARDDYVVIDDGLAGEEYARIQFVDGTRLWFSSPYTTSYKAGLSRAHLLGATVREVTLVTKTAGTDYSLNALTGTITELVDFGAGTVIASYTTDFVMPTTYPLALNASPTLGDSSGKWTGKPVVDGTYTLGLWSSRTLTLTLFGESNSYKSTSDSSNVDFLVGSATQIEPYDLIASGTSCFNCHQELAFHGFGRRGFESCVLCHGTSGSEDRPKYVSANAPATTGVTISFRTMLHKLHQGTNLVTAATYDVIGFGSGSYPDNFAVANYQHVVFPAEPGGTDNCVKCHQNNAWREPKERAHPTDQVAAIKRWSVVCGSCHDSPDAQAHIAVQTDSAGNESCGICHARNRDEDVQRVHKSY
jgi:OmcA/MtrC family decaheme c-type cytochrome